MQEVDNDEYFKSKNQPKKPEPRNVSPSFGGAHKAQTGKAGEDTPKEYQQRISMQEEWKGEYRVSRAEEDKEAVPFKKARFSDTPPKRDTMKQTAPKKKKIPAKDDSHQTHLFEKKASPGQEAKNLVSPTKSSIQ